MDNIKEKALAYHRTGRPGKIEVISSKPCKTAEELSLAYTPGVAQPVLALVAEAAVVVAMVRAVFGRTSSDFLGASQ